ncbi:MAG: T9SS type A sorting domain-containing protein [Bacteroidota bacterium]|nr:T9SS type A sorting domain-containing protein [Bacteroidota bacterium]
MKRISHLFLTFILIIETLCPLFGQSLYDNTWLIGFGSNLIDRQGNRSGLTSIQFNNDSLECKYPLKGNKIAVLCFTNASISDASGELLYYTDGFHIYNRNHEIALGGDTINPGYIWEGYYGGAYPVQNGAIFLPMPGKKDQTILIHKPQDISSELIREFTGCFFLYYSLIDNMGDRGWGEVIKKNEIVHYGDIAQANLNACRHANGRDWWIVQKQSGKNIYYFFLLDPQGIRLHHEQVIGYPGDLRDFNGNDVFTKSGDKYVLCFYPGELLIFDFDRCSGYFSNPTHIKNEVGKELSFCVAISPNDRFLYYCTTSKIWQFDLNSNNIENSKSLVSVYDGTLYRNIWTANFYHMSLAPDDKIYISCFGGNNSYIHRINHPNLKGENCNVQQRAVFTTSEMLGTLPIFPNFDLGPIAGSSCDTIYSITNSDKLTIHIKIVQDQINIENSGEYLFSIPFGIHIYDAQGKLAKLEGRTIYREAVQINVSDLIPGVYFYQIVSDDKSIGSGKFIKI